MFDVLKTLTDLVSQKRSPKKTKPTPGSTQKQSIPAIQPTEEVKKPKISEIDTTTVVKLAEAKAKEIIRKQRTRRIRYVATQKMKFGKNLKS